MNTLENALHTLDSEKQCWNVVIKIFKKLLSYFRRIVKGREEMED